MAFVEIEQGRIALERIDGAPPTLVFLHEGLGSIAQWRDFPRSLCTASDSAGIVYERFGYGASDPITLPRPLSFMHDEARGPLPALLASERVGDFVLVGHSDGASIALIHASARLPGLRGVVAIAPHVFVEPMCVASIARIRAEYDAGTTDLRARLARYHGANVDGAFLGWSGAWLDPEFTRWSIEALLPAIDVPILVVQGESDPYGTLAQVDAIRARCGDVDALILPDCGHAPHRERPRETEAAAAGFLTRLRRLRRS